MATHGIWHNSLPRKIFLAFPSFSSLPYHQPSHMYEFRLEMIIHLSNYKEALPVKTSAFKAVVGAVGRTPCSYLWRYLVDAESLGAHSACCASWRLLFPPVQGKCHFFVPFFFFFWSGRGGGGASCSFSLIVAFDTLEARKSVSFAVPLLTAISQPLPHSLPTHHCFTGTS